MDSQQSHGGSSIGAGLAGTVKAGHNRMDLFTMLNPPDEASTTDSHYFQSKVETHQHLINSPTNGWTEQGLQLPPLRGLVHSSEPRGPLPTIHPHSSQALPTPSPSVASSQIYNVLENSQYRSQSLPTKRQHDRHLPSSASGACLSPQRTAQQEFRFRESSWSAPRPRVYAPYSPPYTYSSQGVARSNLHHNTPLPLPSNHSHSNKPYTLEQSLFIRYHRDDCGKIPWPKILTLFLKQFPEYQNRNLNVAGLSSRYYRDNKVPKLDEQGELAVDNNRKVIMIPCKVRGRDTEGKEIPYMFVDRYPDQALLYDWVKLEDKEKARQILQDFEEEVKETGISEWKRHQQSFRKLIKRLEN